MFKSKSSRADKAAKQQQSISRQNYFENCHRTYSCIHCRAHLANHDELISKLFQGNHGRAYLFNRVVNVGCKQAVERELLTGLHAVADIYCDSCGATLGWKYEQAFEPSQKYKEGKYIIELVHMLKENSWDLTSYNAEDFLKEEEEEQEEGEEEQDEKKVEEREEEYHQPLRLGANDKSNIGRNNFLDSSRVRSDFRSQEIGVLDTNNIIDEEDRHACSRDNRQTTSSRSMSLSSMIKNGVNNNLSKRDSNDISRLALNDNNIPAPQVRCTDSCHEATAAAPSHDATLNNSNPTQSSSIFSSQYNRDNDVAQVELVNGIELIERSLNQLRLDIQQGSSSYFGARSSQVGNVNSVASSTAAASLSVRDVAHSLCSSRSPSDVCSSSSGTDISANADG